jgi:hypothetical protein
MYAMLATGTSHRQMTTDDLKIGRGECQVADALHAAGACSPDTTDLLTPSMIRNITTLIAAGNGKKSTTNHDFLFADNARVLLEDEALVNSPEKGRRWKALATASRLDKGAHFVLNLEEETDSPSDKSGRSRDLDDFFAEFIEDDLSLCWDDES